MLILPENIFIHFFLPETWLNLLDETPASVYQRMLASKQIYVNKLTFINVKFYTQILSNHNQEILFNTLNKGRHLNLHEIIDYNSGSCIYLKGIN